jgi:hypothetical protein
MNSSRRQQKMLSRFEGRKDLGKSELYERYFKGEGLSLAEVIECLGLIESELGISAGVLRPEDKLDMLFEPVPTNNPLKWLTYQARAGDRQAEISYQLTKRLTRYGTFDDWTQIETIDDLVRAWCGKIPRRA